MRGPRCHRDSSRISAKRPEGRFADTFRTRPTASAGALATGLRRLGLALRGVLHGTDDLVVAGAATQVAGEVVAHVRFGRMRLFVEQRLRNFLDGLLHVVGGVAVPAREEELGRFDLALHRSREDPPRTYPRWARAREEFWKKNLALRPPPK